VIASRHLRLIAGETAVPALVAMLADERTAALALYGLQPIPGAVATDALGRALATTSGPTKLGVIAALGERRDAAAIALLVPLLAVPESSAAVATALGRIGGRESASALAGAYGTASEALKPALAAAMMAAAEPLVAAGDVASAQPIFDTLAADTALPASLRQAAVLGRISTAGAGAPALVLEQLTQADASIRDAAIATIPKVYGPDAIEPICALLPKAPEAVQIQLLSVLSGYPGDRVRPTVLAAAQSDQASVRTAAMNALEKVGDASVVPFVANAAALALNAEQAAARSALAGLKGRTVDDAILELLRLDPPDAVRGELVLAAGARRIFLAKPLVAAALSSASEFVRIQALRAMRTIGTPSDVDAALDVLLGTADETEREEAAKTAGELARMATATDWRSRAVRTRLTEGTAAESRARLIALLPIIGDAAALPVLRTALSDPDADVVDASTRAIVAWPTAEARDDIIGLARNSRNETHRLLALRGLVRVVRLDRYRNPQAAVADLRLAAELSWRPEEQKLVLGALAQFPCREALDLAAGFLREESTRAEAQAAVDAIKERMPKESIRQ
jgi:HEAT repeat protein